MKALRMETPAEARKPLGEQRVVRLSPAAGPESAATALADFMEEARTLLDRLQASWKEREAGRPLEQARRETLKQLARREDWVDLHDLPGAGSLGRVASRSVARGLVQERLVEVSRDARYPNMTFLRITSAGREHLRRLSVKEAMGYLRGRGDGREVADAAEDARRSLRRLASFIG
jgi:hypothetical protein